ncbi:hypothetical protein C1645_768780, partial [Glomus cerebriforme]
MKLHLMCLLYLRQKKSLLLMLLLRIINVLQVNVYLFSRNSQNLDLPTKENLKSKLPMMIQLQIQKFWTAYHMQQIYQLDHKLIYHR